MRALVLVAAVAFFAGCGETTSQELPLLPSSALPGLSSSTESVSADDLAADFGAGADPVSGLVDGRERVFQGESHDLDRVVSRTSIPTLQMRMARARPLARSRARGGRGTSSTPPLAPATGRSRP